MLNWPKRVSEWRAAIRHAKNAGKRVSLWAMVKTVWDEGVVPRSVWRERMRYGCYVCPLFDHEHLICRGTVQPWSSYGCRCYVVFKALSPEPYHGGCYGRAFLGNGFGWGAYKFPSRLAVILSFPRFLLRR